MSWRHGNCNCCGCNVYCAQCLNNRLPAAWTATTSGITMSTEGDGGLSPCFTIGANSAFWGVANPPLVPNSTFPVGVCGTPIFDASFATCTRTGSINVTSNSAVAAVDMTSTDCTGGAFAAPFNDIRWNLRRDATKWVFTGFFGTTNFIRVFYSELAATAGANCRVSSLSFTNFLTTTSAGAQTVDGQTVLRVGWGGTAVVTPD